MINNENLQDLFLRYNVVLSKRYTKKQKQIVVKSLEADLKSVRDDVKIDNFKNQGGKSHNVYVGKIKNAKRIIATYYDTPSKYFGDYYPLDNKRTYKASISFIFVTSLILIILGILYTQFIVVPILSKGDFYSAKSILSIASYFIFFILLSKTLKGLADKNTAIRNSSSLIFLLTYIFENKKNTNTSFAFLDDGCKNNAGMERLKELNPTAQIIYLDSIGARENIKKFEIDHRESLMQRSSLPDGTILFVASSDEKEDYVIRKKDLNSRMINENNLQALFEYLNDGGK